MGFLPSQSQIVIRMWIFLSVHVSVEFASFEVLTFKLGGLYPIIFLIIYHPPKPTGRFLAELPEFLSTI